MKSLGLVALPFAFDTVTFPVVAAWGTVTVSAPGVTAETVAATPLKATVLAAAVALKPAPDSVTWLPGLPVPGENPVIRTADPGFLVIESRLPTAS
jgi:hypothetical protein